jgi:hypothetical protein
VWKSALSAIAIRPTVSAFRCFQTSSWSPSIQSRGCELLVITPDDKTVYVANSRRLGGRHWCATRFRLAFETRDIVATITGDDIGDLHRLMHATEFSIRNADLIESLSMGKSSVTNLLTTMANQRSRSGRRLAGEAGRPLWTLAALAFAIPSSWRSRRKLVSNSAKMCPPQAAIRRHHGPPLWRAPPAAPMRASAAASFCSSVAISAVASAASLF